MQEVHNEREFVLGNYEEEIEDGIKKCNHYTRKLEERVNLNID